MDQETITTEAPGIDSGADTNAGILTEADLASSFLERVDEQPEEKPSETEATEQTSETVGAEAEEDSEGNVLSQSEQSEETETAEYEEEPAEGEQPKAVSKLLKQVGKLTARAKGAEESVDALKAEIQNLKIQPQDQKTQEQGQPALEDISSMGDLEKLRKEALSAKRWALQHIGIGVRKKSDGVFAEEEVVALVVGDDEGGEVLHLYAANRLHAQFVILYGFYALDAIFGQSSGGTTDAAQVEAAMIFASLDDHLGTVALGKHDEGTTGSLKLVHECVHAAGGGRTEGTRGIAFGRFGGTCIIDGELLEVFRQFFSCVQTLPEFGVSEIASNDQRPRKREPGTNRMFGKFRPDGIHALVQIDVDGIITLFHKLG